MYCKTCGNKIEDGNLFCTKCGAPVDKPSGNEQNSQSYAQPAYAGTYTAAKPVAPARSKLQLVALIVSIVTLVCCSVTAIIRMTDWYYFDFEVFIYNVTPLILLASGIMLLISRIKNLKYTEKLMAITFTLYAAFNLVYFIINCANGYFSAYSIFFIMILCGVAVLYWLIRAGIIKKQLSDQLLSLGIAIYLVFNVLDLLIALFSDYGVSSVFMSLAECGILAVFALLIIDDKDTFAFLRNK